MSYCRFSSDNWRSDVYVYADCAGGYTTHVASNRVVGEVPPDPLFNGAIMESLDDPRLDEWLEQHRVCMDWLDTAERAPIGGPFDGECFNDDDLPDLLERLESLRAAGYNVPAYVFDEIREEMAAGQHATADAATTSPTGAQRHEG